MKISFFPFFSAFLALIFFSFQTPQPGPAMDYEREWKRIDSLEQEGLLRSALEETETLYERADTEKNYPQVARAVIYRAKFVSQLEEDGPVQAITLMQKEAEQAAVGPLRSVLQSMLAERYAQYAEVNYGKLADRTHVPGELPEDIQTWSLEQLAAESSRLYLVSLETAGLKKIPIDRYAAILTEAQNTEDLRPTLYDFLAHRALQHFSNERLYLTAPAYRFYLEQAEAFAPAPRFAAFDFAARDTASFHYRALNIYQELLAFHLPDKDPAALVDADLQRLRFAFDQSVHDLKDSLYLDALQHLENQYRQHPASAEVLFFLADYHFGQGQQYQPNPEDWLRWEWKKAKVYCDEAVRRFPESYGARLCENLLTQINGQELTLRTESVNLPNQSMLARMEYRNLERAHLRIVRLTEEERDQLNQQRPSEVIQALNQKKVLRRWSVKLPITGDYQMHATEIRIDDLPSGIYAIQIAADAEFSEKEGQTGYLFTQVSRLGYFYRRSDDGSDRFLVVDRETGRPLEGVLAEFFTMDYSGRGERNRRKIGQRYTDADGMVIPPVQERNSYQIRLSQNGDALYMGEGYYSYSRDYRGQGREQTHFFLDRAIYRPGQTVYFKGLLLSDDAEEMPGILPDREVTVTFYDVNNQEVASQNFRSNRFGTFNGSFVAPSGGLRGQMRLQSSIGNSAAGFRVEEYKRPRFEVVVDTLAGTPGLGETVTVTGTALAFAGSPVDGAQVRYRVVREVRFPWLPWWSRGGFNPWRSQSMEITNGELTTAADGSFQITFVAQPDRSVPRDKKPEFVFSVYVDVTDITGEVQSTQKDVHLGYIGLKVDLRLDDQVDRTKPLSLELHTTNLDGGFVPSRGSVRIHRLQGPGRVLVERYWEKPDQIIIPEREFRRYFPHFAYREEGEIETWPRVGKQLDQDFDTGSSRRLAVATNDWPVGWYVVVVKTEDQQGQLVEEKKYFSLYDSEDQQLPAGTLSRIQTTPVAAEPGQSVAFFIGTSDGPLHVLWEQERRGTLEPVGWQRAAPWQTLHYEVTEADRGNLLLHATYVRFNRAFSEQYLVRVPWTQKELQITYETFRDKLQPGAEEEWRLRISGPGKDAVAAEMVAAMYDASLDQFVPHSWQFAPYPILTGSRHGWSPRHFGETYLRRSDQGYRRPDELPRRSYRSLNWFGYSSYGVAFRGGRMEMMAAPEIDGAQLAMADTFGREEAGAAKAMAEPAETVPAPPTADTPPAPPLRTNLKETVFFFPELRTDARGDLLLKFTMNEALTRWKLLGFAHTTDLAYGLTEKEVVTQKELMVIPNPPRFVREGDRLEFTAKVSNLTDRPLAGKATLHLLDGVTLQPVDEVMGNDLPEINFRAAGGQSDRLAWELTIPQGEVPLLVYQVRVQAGDFSDGEQSSLPVLTNRMLVTETLPMAIRGGRRETFTFEGLEKLQTSKTLQPHQFTLEFTSNPAWYAVKALPYLMEYPHECIEQIFNRYYANSLAASVANDHPRVKEVFERWKDTDALESPLALNEELKSVLVEETPWVLQAQSEAEQRRRIGLLFDLQRMSEEKAVALTQIAERQEGNGGFSWFPGGRPSWFMTQYIVEGLGHLDALGVADMEANPAARRIAEGALRFVDTQVQEYYRELLADVKEGRTTLEADHLSNLLIHYLYARSFFPDRAMEEATQEAHRYLLSQARQHWTRKGLYEQGLIALALHRYLRDDSAQRIVRSLRERALTSEELGMYWAYDRGFFWHQLPIETHALMIELFGEVTDDAAAVEELKLWLLKNKQTNHWKTTKATAAATYALLRYGSDWLAAEAPVEIDFPQLRNKEVEAKITEAQATAEPGTGYFKTSWSGPEITPEMAKVRLRNPNSTVAWGALYWQYFEELDRIETFEDTPLTLGKQLFREASSDTGPVLRPVSETDPLQAGDKVVVRIELRVDRDMEYLHLKDMRAGGLEPLNVLSTYKWQGGLGYYESTGDAATHFFFGFLPKGTYVFEYPLRVTHRGDFSNGISTIQCMYAPEFTSHSQGIRVQVK